MVNIVLMQQWRTTNLKEKGITERVAETEYKVFLWMFRHRLYDAVLHPHGVLRDTVVVYAGAAVAFIEEQSAP